MPEQPASYEAAEPNGWGKLNKCPKLAGQTWVARVWLWVKASIRLEWLNRLGWAHVGQ